jgi:hypothetical protein
MEREPRPDPIQLTGIHLNLEAQAIEFEDRHGTVGRLRFAGETVLDEGRPLLLMPGGDPATPQEPPASPDLQRPFAPDPGARMIHNSSPPTPRVRF